MDAHRLARLLHAHGAALALFARQWCEQPEDVVQEAFCRLASQRTWPDDPVAWLYRHADVLARSETDDGSVHLRVGIDPAELARFETRMGRDWRGDDAA